MSIFNNKLHISRNLYDIRYIFSNLSERNTNRNTLKPLNGENPFR